MPKKSSNGEKDVKNFIKCVKRSIKKGNTDDSLESSDSSDSGSDSLNSHSDSGSDSEGSHSDSGSDSLNSHSDSGSDSLNSHSDSGSDSLDKKKYTYGDFKNDVKSCENKDLKSKEAQKWHDEYKKGDNKDKNDENEDCLELKD
jgi:hypothetical protein